MRSEQEVMKSGVAFNPKLRKERVMWDAVGIPSGGAELLDTVERGLNYGTLKKITHYSGFQQTEIIKALELNRSTLSRRAKAGRFNRIESDKLYRFTEVFSEATKLFEGDTQAARDWLEQPIRALGNRTPISLINTLSGSETVLRLIGRLEDGVFS
jgi:putative toxin-antitoxin system antitoxin component (TIGR02293 family)